eukprot:COSAG06_NODE_29534_length_554_cov_3.556044_1_plen_23_part_10
MVLRWERRPIVRDLGVVVLHVCR